MASLVCWSSGVHITGTRLWCDAARAQGVTFVSGADVVPRGKLGRVVTTERTRRLAGGVLGDVLPALFGRPFAIGRARLELLPAGRLPGSAQLRVELDDRVVLYAGAVNPAGGRLAEPAQLRGCDLLVVAAPLRATLPPRAQVEAELVTAVRAALDEGVTPLVSAPSLGLAAELVALLAVAGLPLRVPARLGARLAVYARLGVPVPARVPRLPKLLPGEVVVWPEGTPPPARLRDARPLLVGQERRFALADRADLPSLVDYALASGASEVQVVGGWSEEIARAFGRRKLRVSPLGPPEQIRLF